MIATTSAGSRTSRELLHGRDLLCFSHDWNGDPLSKTHVMRILSRHNRVLWINSIGYRAPTASGADIRRAFQKIAAAASPIREVEPNIFVLNPLAIPAYGNPTLRQINRAFLRLQVRRAMTHLGFRRPLNWVFNPAAGLLAGGFNEDAIIYYCVDEYTEFSGVDTRSLASIEHDLLERADLVLTSSERLYQSKSRVNPRTFMMRHGVDYNHFRKALDPAIRVPDEVAHLPGPVIGYFGLIAQDWVDVDLLTHVADSFPDGSLVMVGKVTMDVSELEKRPNVHLLGRKPYADLPGYCNAFDVALIPFPISEVTLNANPLKAREYLAAGLPVVSTAIPEVEVLGQCLIGKTSEDFVRQIRHALEDPGPRWDRSETMRGESWEARVESICSLFASVSRRKSTTPAIEEEQ